jgi:hypothetical protein
MFTVSQSVRENEVKGKFVPILNQAQGHEMYSMFN